MHTKTNLNIFMSARTWLVSLGAGITALVRGTVEIVYSARKAGEIERLYGLSDAELSRRGISRDRIFHAVVGEKV